jgi:hypothetical protein
VYLCTYPRASKLAFSPTPNTQECFRLHPLFWRIIPDDMSIPLRRSWVIWGGAMGLFRCVLSSLRDMFSHPLQMVGKKVSSS